MLPHGDELCLIDGIETQSDEGIVCTANSHRDAANPYRIDDRLPWPIAIEYAAQAMALHGAGTGAAGGTKVIGAVRGLQTSGRDLDAYVEPLEIHARVKVAGAASAVYSFVVAAGSEQVCKGTLTLIGAGLDTVRVAT